VPVARIAKAVFKVNGFNNAVAPTPAQQMRRLLQIELNFVQTVCTPSPEQLRQLRQDGLKQITDAINNWQVENGGTLPSYAREIVQDEVMASVRTRLSPAQVARYVSEIQKRKANVRQACARNLVVRLDRELCLTARQREKLCAELAGNWDDAWTVSVVMTSMNEQGVIPTVPDELIVPHLDALQRLLWNRLLKRGKIIWRVDETAFLGMTPPDMDDED
jgi:DNA-directed RNA polymerase specialized sigma subunit